MTVIAGLQTPAGSKVLLDLFGFQKWWEATSMLPLLNVTAEHVRKAISAEATKYEVRATANTSSGAASCLIWVSIVSVLGPRSQLGSTRTASGCAPDAHVQCCHCSQTTRAG